MAKLHHTRTQDNIIHHIISETAEQRITGAYLKQQAAVLCITQVNARCLDDEGSVC